MSGLRRRAVIAAPLAATAASAAARRRASAQAAPTESFVAAEQAILAGRTPIASGVTIDMPHLSENGNSVDLAVRVESPTTAEDHVTAIHILAEKNPYPRVASFGLSPRAGRAEVATRIRLATTQTILVLAETSRGQVHRASREVIVVLGACVEGG
jgi:sulfur-oxidizing protein SoxY